jgi:signal transduction histidine kinase
MRQGREGRRGSAGDSSRRQAERAAAGPPAAPPARFRRRLPEAGWVAAVAVLVGVFGWSFRNTERLIDDAAWRQHTYQVIGEIRALAGALIDAQAGERGYLLTGDERFLAPYRSGRQGVAVHLATLRALTADNPRQQRRLAAFEPAANAELDRLERAIARRGQLAAVVRPAAASAAADRRAMDELRSRVAALEGEEHRLLAQRDLAMRQSVRRTNLSLAAGLAAGLALLTAAFVTLRREIGERRQSEAAVRRVNARLASANAELDAFCYSVSHDLRAPLRAIDGFSLALVEDLGERLAAAERELLARIRAAAQRMAQLIDDLLRLSRISRTELALRPVDLSALAAEIVAGLRGREPLRRAAIDIQPEVRAQGDERLLRIVLENLLGNAWKFTRHREQARIEFGTERDVGVGTGAVGVAGGDGAGGGPVYLVRDDGAGFDMQYAAQLFAAFQRLHSASEFEGTGIGLATVARIVHLHGGRVWAEAAVGRGAAFRFTLGESAGAAGQASEKGAAG